jgi:methylmalonyl-CoA/ethylmalonyl-CoA epimerase
MLHREEGIMLLDICHIGQIGLAVADVDRAEAFYRDVLGLRRLYRFGDLSFFDCAGVRLMLEKSANPEPRGAVLYLRCADIALAVRTLRERGLAFLDEPHLIARMEDHDLWMTFFRDPDRHVLALMQEAPKGYVPPAVG